ncbi:adenylate/guanylate cyclase domain-containing protein [Aggregatilineales bacterium SYSU G02658]
MSDLQTQILPNAGSATLVRHMRQRVSDAMQVLRSQADLLRQRGVTLDSASIETLSALKAQFDQLETAAVNRQAELNSLRALARTAALISSSLRTDDVLNQVMDTVIQITQAERAYIMLRDEHGELAFRVARGIDLEEMRDDGSSGRVVSLSIVRQVVETGQPILTDNASADPNYNSNLSIAGFQLRSILAVPLILREQVIGVVYADNRIVSGLFKPADVDLLMAFAGQAAVAIENARLIEATQQRLAEATAIRDRMDNIFTSIVSGIITLNFDGQVIVCNAAAERILGCELIGQRLLDLIPDADSLIASTLSAVQQTMQATSVECHPHVAGEPRFWRVSVSPLRFESGQALGLALVLDDLTEVTQREQQLKEVQRYLPAGLVKKARDLDTGAQERLITAIFCDVRGFTTFSERLQPQALMTIINRYLGLASDAINFVEGVVDKYMGDAVTGMFNTQLNPQDDHARRAVQAALQLMSDLRAQHEVMPEDQRLFYGIGIHTGPAVLGVVGGQTRKEFTAIGEASDIAKYLQEQAGKGEIIISGTTHELVKDVYECEPMNQLPRPKAGYEHIACYRVLRRRKGAHSSFIDDELRALLSAPSSDDTL